MKTNKKRSLHSQLFLLQTISLLFEIVLVFFVVVIVGLFVFDKVSKETVEGNLVVINENVGKNDNYYSYGSDIIVINSDGEKKLYSSKQYKEGLINNITSDITTLKENTIYKRNRVYYAYVTYNDLVIVTLFNTTDKIDLTLKIVVSSILVFIVCSACGSILILQVFKKPIKRIQVLTNFVTEMPNDMYEREYIDNGTDEIAILSKAINGLRESFLYLEDKKMEVVQNVGHDLKTPVAVIKTYSEAIMEEIEPIESNAIIQEQCNKLEKKIEQLLMFNRVEYIPKERLEQIDMKPLVEKIITNYKHAKGKIPFEVDLEDAQFTGLKENYLIIIENIIDNALRYAKSVIRITLRDNYLQIYNDGPKIDKYFIDNGFKPYEKGKGGKFGLGMSIAAKTLYAFDMKLLVKNEDVGVSFTISK